MREQREQPGRKSTGLSGKPKARHEAAPGPMSPDAALALQRALGNAVVSRMIAAEEETAPAGPSAVHEVLRGPGRPLNEGLRSEMEARLGADFSDVRLHTGPAAERSAEEIGARAYTSGTHVVLGGGGGDKHTLAHELTHVIQQRSGPVAGTDNGAGLSLSDPSDRFERAAEANAHQALSGPVPASTSGSGPDHELGPSAETSPSPIAEPIQRYIEVTADEDSMREKLITDGFETLKAFRKRSGAGDLDGLVDAVCGLEAFQGQSASSVGSLVRGIAKKDPPRDAGQLKILAQFVNAIEEHSKTVAAAKIESKDIPLGTEFTFVKKDLVELNPEAVGGQANGEQKRARVIAQGLMDRWREKVEEARGKGVSVSEASGKAGIGSAVKFTYPNAVDGPWYWVLDIDYSCLETQTQKASLAQLKMKGKGLPLHEIIESDIFGVAKELGLSVSRRLNPAKRIERGEDLAGGGGHISLDAEKSFGGSVTLLIDLLEKLQQDAENWQENFNTSYKENGKNVGENDTNAPWMKDLKLNSGGYARDSYLTELKKIRSDAQQGKVDLTGALRSIAEFNKKLTREFPTSANGLQGAALEEHLMHYQAVNIEHVGDRGEGARIELRDIPAQDSFDTLVKDVRAIHDYIKEIKAQYSNLP